MTVEQKNRNGNITWKHTPKIASAKCYKWSPDGTVPLECECRVGFGPKVRIHRLNTFNFTHPSFNMYNFAVLRQEDPWSKSLVFDSSFLMPFRQRFEITITGPEIDQNITCDDFVIPMSQNETKYTIENLIHKALANTATVGMCSRETATFGRCVQEMNMFDEMASLLIQNKTSDFWPQIAFLTQRVVDACYQSMKSNGAEVLDLELEFQNYSSLI